MPTDNNYWGNPQGVPRQQPQDQPQAQAQPQVEQLQAQVQSQAAQPQAQAQPQQQVPAGTQPLHPSAESAPNVVPAYAQAMPYQTTPAEPKKSHGWIIAIVVIVCVFLLSIFCVKSCTEAVSSFSSFGYTYGGPVALDQDAIAIIDIDGTIQYDGSACSPEGLKELLDEAEEDSHIKGVVLRVNSGGGTATAGEEMAEYVHEFSKPVVVSSAAVNASAAYEISSQADYIYVAKSTEIGAIGTAMEVMDLSGLLDMLGVNMDTIVSADQKDSSYGYRALTDEERAYYQAMVDEINQVFLDNVAAGRGMSAEQVSALATGMPFTGVTAVQNGLADAVGTREDAIAKCAELAGITDYTTTDLYFSTYDLSSLAYLLGEDRAELNDIAKLLEATKNGNIS